MLKNWGADGKENKSEKIQSLIVLLSCLIFSVITAYINYSFPAFYSVKGEASLSHFFYIRELSVYFYIAFLLTIFLLLKFNIIPAKGSSNIQYISLLAGATIGLLLELIIEFINFIDFPIVYLEFYYRSFLILLVCFTTCLFIRKIYAKNSQQSNNKPSGIFGTAEFADEKYLKEQGLYNTEHSLFGKDNKGKYLCHPICNRTIISMSGGGKTAGITIPALLTENRPCFVHDPKGELYAVTARHRIKNFGREIILFDPFGVTKQKAFKLDKDESMLKSHSINPFSYFPIDNIRFKDRFITSLTAALVKTEGSSRYGTHFEDTAKIIISGIIDFLMIQGNNSFLNLYNIISEGPQKIKDRINAYIEDNSLNINLLSPHLKETWAILEATGKEETGSIFSTTLRQLRWLSDSNLRILFQNDTCDLIDFISGKADIFIVLPEDQIKEQSRVVRLILALTSSLLIQTDREKLSQKQYLFLLDELGQLGYNEELENYLEILRARNCVFWSVFQTYSQIKLYQKPDLFINSKMLQLFSCSDPDIMLLIQKLGGIKSVMIDTRGDNQQKMELFKGSTSKSSHEAGTDLIKFNETRELPFDEQLVFIQGFKPIRCKKTLYFKEKFLLDLCDRNPLEITL